MLEIYFTHITLDQKGKKTGKLPVYAFDIGLQPGISNCIVLYDKYEFVA